MRATRAHPGRRKSPTHSAISSLWSLTRAGCPASARRERMGRAIVITSGKGGVGKTTTTANLGTALARQGKQVVLVDADIGLRNLDVVLGLENRIVYHLVDVVQGKCTPQKALIKDRRIDNLFLLPASQTDDKDAVTPGDMRKLIAELKANHNYVL